MYHMLPLPLLYAIISLPVRICLNQVTLDLVRTVKPGTVEYFTEFESNIEHSTAVLERPPSSPF